MLIRVSGAMLTHNGLKDYCGKPLDPADRYRLSEDLPIRQSLNEALNEGFSYLYSPLHGQSLKHVLR